MCDYVFLFCQRGKNKEVGGAELCETESEVCHLCWTGTGEYTRIMPSRYDLGYILWLGDFQVWLLPPFETNTKVKGT